MDTWTAFTLMIPIIFTKDYFCTSFIFYVETVQTILFFDQFSDSEFLDHDGFRHKMVDVLFSYTYKTTPLYLLEQYTLWVPRQYFYGNKCFCKLNRKMVENEIYHSHTMSISGISLLQFWTVSYRINNQTGNKNEIGF